MKNVEQMLKEVNESISSVIVDKVEFKPQNTSIVKGVSNATKVLVDHVKIDGTSRVLDYGCGSGRNMLFIKENCNNIEVHGTDIIEQLEKEKERHDRLREMGCIITESNLLGNNSYDKILNTHVLNVIASDEVKNIVVRDIYNKLKKDGVAYFEVRTKSDVESAKTKEKYGDGYKIKKGNCYTYQEAITKEKMTNLLENNGFNIIHHTCNSSKHFVLVSK